MFSLYAELSPEIVVLIRSRPSRTLMWSCGWPSRDLSRIADTGCLVSRARICRVLRGLGRAVATKQL